ncbi:MAG: GNAT family N-acetyltransferase [Catenulispora sp.]|nr:GNAT family N-acetyltransferase [Catenulispora sp.]
MTLVITPADFTDEHLCRLIAEHLDDMHATSPAESVHALDSTGLQAVEVSMWTISRDGDLLGCGALKELSSSEGEIKAMRTTPAARGAGIGARMLVFLVEQARERGYKRLSLETGSQPFFAPARRLYERHGFVECPPFADYVLDPASVFMTLEL